MGQNPSKQGGARQTQKKTKDAAPQQPRNNNHNNSSNNSTTTSSTKQSSTTQATVESDFSLHALLWPSDVLDELWVGLKKMLSGAHLSRYEIIGDTFWLHLLAEKKKDWFRERTLEAVSAYPMGSSKTRTMENRKAVLLESYEKEFNQFIQELQGNPSTLKDRYLEYWEFSTNPSSLYSRYFEWSDSVSLEDVRSYNVARHYQWLIEAEQLKGVSESSVVHTISKLLDEEKDQGLVVRIVVSSILPATKSNKCISMIASKLSGGLGLNHVGLQIGPYLVHWHTGNQVTFHDIGNHDRVIAMIYPDPNFSLSRLQSSEPLQRLCEVIAQQNLTEYSTLNNNCQHFVDKALEAIDCKPTWVKGGMMSRFMKDISSLTCTRKEMKIWDMQLNEHVFHSYDGFKTYCRQNDTVMSLLQKMKEDPASLAPGESEFLQVLKAVERGYQLQLTVEESYEDVIFPVLAYEANGRTTGAPGITMFAFAV